MEHGRGDGWNAAMQSDLKICVRLLIWEPRTHFLLFVTSAPLLTSRHCTYPARSMEYLEKQGENGLISPANPTATPLNMG